LDNPIEPINRLIHRAGINIPALPRSSRSAKGRSGRGRVCAYAHMSHTHPSPASISSDLRALVQITMVPISGNPSESIAPVSDGAMGRKVKLEEGGEEINSTHPPRLRRHRARHRGRSGPWELVCRPHWRCWCRCPSYPKIRRADRVVECRQGGGMGDIQLMSRPGAMVIRGSFASRDASFRFLKRWRGCW